MAAFEVVDINLMDIEKPANPDEVNPLFKVSNFQRQLLDAGVNPEIYMSALRALVLDYGFNIRTALSIMGDVLSKPAGDRDSYFSNFIFTVGRKIGYVFNVSKPDSTINNLKFTKPVGIYVRTDITPFKYAGTPFSAVPFGLIRYNPNEVQVKSLLPYTEALDANLLLEDSDHMGGFEIYRQGIVKMVVSDREADIGDQLQDPRVADLLDVKRKRVKGNMHSMMSKIFRGDRGKAIEGLYDIPEWSPTMIFKRENRVKWMIRKLMRNWRAKRVSQKRATIWNSGYLYGEYDPSGTGSWDINDPTSGSHLSNWIRERAVRLFDESVLAPVYEEVTKKLESVVHNNYPVTEEELGNFLLDWLDLVWYSNQSEQKVAHASHLLKLLTRYKFDNAYAYFYNWMIVTGLLESDKNLKHPTLGEVESIIKHSFPKMTDDPADPANKILEIFSVVYSLCKREIVSTRKLVEIVYRDSDFVESFYSYLDSKSDRLEFELMERRRAIMASKANPTEVEMSLCIVDSILCGILGREGFTDKSDFKMTADGDPYPARYDSFVANDLPEELAYANPNEAAMSSILSLSKSSPLYFLLDRYVEGLELTYQEHGGADVPLTLERLMTRFGTIDETEGIKKFGEALLASLYPIFSNKKYKSSQDIEASISKYESKLDIFFSQDPVGRGAALQTYSTEEEEMIDAMIKLEGLSLDKTSENMARFSSRGRERIYTVRDNEPVRVTICPTVEFSILKTNTYKYEVSFENAKDAILSSNGGDRGILITELQSNSPTQHFVVNIPEKQTGYIRCRITGLLDNGTPFSQGDMPQIKVERTKRCLRSKTTFTEFEKVYRPYIRLHIKDGAAVLTESGTSNSRNAYWSMDIQGYFNRIGERYFSESGATLCAVSELFKLCYSLHRAEDFISQASKWYYKPTWYNGALLDRDGLSNAIEMATVPFKDIALYGRVDLKAQQELDTKKNKATLKILKGLFLTKDYNKFLESLNGSFDTQEMYNNNNTIDPYTMYFEPVERLYKGGVSTSEALDIALTQIPYLCVLNFIGVVLNKITDRDTSKIRLCYPDRYTDNNHSRLEYAKECIRELLSRMTLLFANMSIEKNVADIDNDKTNSQVFQFKKFFTMSWKELNENAKQIPSTFSVLENIREDKFEVVVPISYTTAIVKKFAAFGTAYQTFKRYSDLYKYSNLQKDIASATNTLYIQDYVGFNSDETEIPYFCELKDGEQIPILQIPGDRASAFYAIQMGGLYLYLGDFKKNRQEEMEKAQKIIISKMERLRKSVNVEDETADPDIIFNIVRKCKEYNNILV